MKVAKGVYKVVKALIGVCEHFIWHGNAILVDIGRTKIFLHALYFSPYLIPPDFGMLKIA